MRGNFYDRKIETQPTDKQKRDPKYIGSDQFETRKEKVENTKKSNTALSRCKKIPPSISLLKKDLKYVSSFNFLYKVILDVLFSFYFM